MDLFSKLLDRARAASSGSNRKNVREADAAIREARAGRLSVPKMLHSVMEAQLLVPLAEPPVLEGNSVASWKPATVSKQANGAQFLVVFTDETRSSRFATGNPEHSYVLLVDARWVLDALPPGHGIAFNPAGDNGFEWTAEGISAYRADLG